MDRRVANRVWRIALVALAAGSLSCRMQESDGKETDPAASANPMPGASTPSEHVRTVHARDGEIASLVRSEYEQATSDGRQLVVYLGATWCEPCQRFHRAVEHGELDATFPKLTLLEFDADHDQERLRAAGYSSRYIPMFALPKPDGRASGKQVEGGIKGDGAVSYVADKLKGLLASN